MYRSASVYRTRLLIAGDQALHRGIGFWADNPQLLHFVLKRGSFQTELLGGSKGTTDDPVAFFQRAPDMVPFGILESRGLRLGGDT